jgi:CPA1 family monovalent cation:H+ antiporter
MTGAVSFLDASAQFVGIAIGGVIIGVLLGRLFVFIHRHLADVFIEVLMTLSVPYITYILAEYLNVSGVLAVVAAGLVRGRYSPEIVSAEMRIIARSVWNLLVFLLSSLVFILIGLQLSGIVGRLTGHSAMELVFYGTLVSAVAIAVRFAWIYPATYLPYLLSARRRERDPAPPEAELFIMSWCGMRGIVSLAAALALPLLLNEGQPFPSRDLIIFLTFVVITVTLVLQGLSLAPLIRTLRVGTDWSGHEEEQHARFALGKVAIAAIDELAAKEKVPAEMAERIRAEFAEKIRIAPPGGHVLSGGADLAGRLRSAAIRAERQELIRIWRENKISDDVLHHLEEDLDYQESRL